MVLASEMRKKSEEGMYTKIIDLIENIANEGQTEIDLSNFNFYSIPENVEKRLNKEGFKILGTRVSW